MRSLPRCFSVAAVFAVTTVVVLIFKDLMIGAGLGAQGHHKDQGTGWPRHAGKEEGFMSSGNQLSPIGSNPSHLGLPMLDERLIDVVRERFVPASSLLTPYNLSRPEQTFFAQHGQDKMVAYIFNNKIGGHFLEAGALDGEYLSNTLYLERHLGWTGILVEPNPNTFEKLRTKNRRALLLNAGLSVQDRATRLNLNLGGKYPELSKFGGKKRLKPSTNVARVDCFPLFTVLAAAGHPVLDLMVLDIVGMEFQVLQSVPWAKVRVRLLVVETNKVEEGIEKLEKFLISQGFKFHKAIGVDNVYYHPDHLTEDMILL